VGGLFLSRHCFCAAVYSCLTPCLEAKAYYEHHPSWPGSSRKRATPVMGASPAVSGLVKSRRDGSPVRQRSRHMSKEALVERLLAVERTCSEQPERWLTHQDELLAWRLRAETAEVKADRLGKKPSRECH
jgi:hypothetical protein